MLEENKTQTMDQENHLQSESLDSDRNSVGSQAGDHHPSEQLPPYPSREECMFDPNAPDIDPIAGGFAKAPITHREDDAHTACRPPRFQ